MRSFSSMRRSKSLFSINSLLVSYARCRQSLDRSLLVECLSWISDSTGNQGIHTTNDVGSKTQHELRIILNSLFRLGKKTKCGQKGFWNRVRNFCAGLHSEEVDLLAGIENKYLISESKRDAALVIQTECELFTALKSDALESLGADRTCAHAFPFRYVSRAPETRVADNKPRYSRPDDCFRF